MAKMSEEERSKPVDIVLDCDTMVGGKPKKKGTTVTVSGNDTVQLFASKRGHLKTKDDK